MATDTSTTNFGPAGFRTVERLGRGAAFEVARVHDAQGHDPGQRRELICKRAAAAPFVAALERERNALVLPHDALFPHLVVSGDDARGGFLVETRAPGFALRELLDGRSPMSAAQWLELAKAAARALAKLHALADGRGPLHFVHGDLSPDNLFFDAPGVVTFIDFSSATWRDAPDHALQGDRGTVPYAAPELTRQEAGPSPATDTYALAATLLAVAVGPPIVRGTTEAARLFEVGAEGILWRRIHERSDLPAAARSALAEALQYDPARRLASSQELAARLDPTFA